jgi:hypothetical protein
VSTGEGSEGSDKRGSSGSGNEVERGSAEGENINKGHFYTNDIKVSECFLLCWCGFVLIVSFFSLQVLIDLILREMRNIPYNCEVTSNYSEEVKTLHGQVRYM